jgi:hypothetical protein
VQRRRPFERHAPTRRSLAVALAACIGVAGGSHVLAAPEDPVDQIETETATGSLAGADLDVVQGEEAVKRLEESDTLAEVAANAGLEPQELKTELLDDPSMFVTDSGFVGYADTLEASSSSWTASALGAAALPADVFALDSRPTSSRVLYLDFDGHIATDPVWGSAGFGGQIASAPFDTDGVAGFSAAEQATIFEVWQRVAEDYRPFDINVTTRDPGVEGLRRSSVIDPSYGQRMVITPSNFTNQSGVIGVALVDVFWSESDHAAYVFTDLAYKRTARTIGEATSHEAGHTLSLGHDGTVSSDYYDGHGDWAPIMGRPVDLNRAFNSSRPVTQWSRGEYAGANRFEDDLAIIAARTGYRPDDHANNAVSATVVASKSTTAGNIERTGDRDVFAVDVAAGTLSVQLRPPSGEAPWSNLAARLVVRNSSGSVVATADPATASGWALNVGLAVPAGRYTIEVQPVGWLSASTGFTTYGSLGAYELVVDAAGIAAPPGAGASAFTPMSPLRLVDTRNGIGASGRVGAGRQVVLQVADGVNVPADATAAVLNVTAVIPAAAGFVTVYPCSDSVPDTSTLNYVTGQTVANTTIAALSGAGQLCVWTFAETDILVDITGWLGPSGTSRLTPIGPTRVVDTRSGLGGRRLGAGATMTVDLNGKVPPGSTAVALNVTGVTASTPGFMTVFPCSGAVPNTSTVNFVAGEARPNNTIVGLTGGRVCIFTDAATEVLVDLLGSYGPSGLRYEPTPPIRVLDTRRSGTLGAGGDVGYAVGADALGGQTPGAAYVNVTAANHTAAGYVTTYDCITRRDTSTVNQKVGQAAANGAIVPLNALQSCAWTFGGGDLIVDLNGWWVP